MTARKFIIFAGVLMLTLFGLGTGFMLAGGLSDVDCPVFHSRFHGDGFRGRISDCFDRKAEALNLTDEQKQQLEELKAQFFEDFTRIRKERKKFFAEIGNEMKKPDADVHRVAGMVTSKLNRIPEVIGAHIDRVLSFYDTLDEEQQKQVLEGIRQRMESRRWHRQHDES